MEQATQRTMVRGPTFIRLLASLADADAPQSRQSLSDRLSHWLDWTHAIALSTALDGKVPEPGAGAPAFDSAGEDACARTRASLAAAIGEREWPALRQRGAGRARVEEDAEATVDYAVFRQRYVSLQRSMQTATGNLRGRLREMLIGKSADMARLAEVDAAMELVLSPREQMLLATVPALLGKHFEHLQQAAPKMLPGLPAENTPAAAGAWLEVFRRDMQSLLLAELDVRFQPVEGLLAALRTH